jgi:protease IV
MNRWIASVAALGLMLVAALCLANPTTRSDGHSPTTAPSTVFAQSAPHFPTPAELIEQLKSKRAEVADLPKVAYFDLTDPISEKPSDFNWLSGQDPGITFRVLMDRLEQARKDKAIRGILLTFGNSGPNLSQAMELRDELNLLRQAGKKTFAYADIYDTTSYLGACAATDVCLLQGGEIMVPGVGFETMFAKGLLDKVGIKADYVQIGEYKGADEQYTRTTASDELRGELNKLSDSLYQQIIDSISLSRNMKSSDVKMIVDDALVPAQVAMDRGLVDHLVDEDGLRALMADEFGQKIDLVEDYGSSPHEQVDLSSPFAFLSLLSKRPAVSDRPAIALIYAEGEIVDGPSTSSMLGGGTNIGADTFREALRIATRDDKVGAIVIRIDSPGGSALASEVMWQAARRAAAKKPVIISVGSMAASGGYYLASSGETIFADPTAIVGSIGVVGGKFVLRDLFTKLGLATETFSRGRNSDLFSSSVEWDDRQRREVTNWMHQTYDQFTQRVMATRQGKIKDIDAVARGRIFSANQALDLGMVDQIGGIHDAIAYGADKAGFKEGEFDVRVIPAARTLADIFNGGSGDETSASPFAPKVEISPDSLLRYLPAADRAALGQELEMMMLLQEHPVLLQSPIAVVVK